MSSSKRVLNKEVHLLDLFFVNELFRIEILDLSGNLDRKVSRIKAGYMRYTGFTGSYIRPVLCISDPQRRYNPDPCNNDSSHNMMLLEYRILPHARKSFSCSRLHSDNLFKYDALAEKRAVLSKTKSSSRKTSKTLNRDELTSRSLSALAGKADGLFVMQSRSV